MAKEYVSNCEHGSHYAVKTTRDLGTTHYKAEVSTVCMLHLLLRSGAKVLNLPQAQSKCPEERLDTFGFCRASIQYKE